MYGHRSSSLLTSRSLSSCSVRFIVRSAIISSKSPALLGVAVLLLPSLLEASAIRPSSRRSSSSFVSTPVFALPAFAPLHNSSRLRRAFSFGKSTALNGVTSEDGGSMSSSGGRILESPSAERNKEVILSVLKSDVLPLLRSTAAGAADASIDSRSTPLKVLEVAAGCGVHTIHLARGVLADDRRVGVQWYPTDPSATSRESIDARVAALEASDAAAKATAVDATDAALKDSIMPARALTLDAEGVMEGRVRGGGMMSDLPDPIADLPDATLDLVVNINMIHISPWEATVGLMRTSAKLLRRGGMLYCYGPYKVNGTAVQSNLNFDASLKSRDASWGVRNLEDVVAEAERCGLKLIKTVEMPANNLSVLYQKQ